MNDDHDPVDPDPDFEARARAAGRALREPAPARGFQQVRAAKRRRTVARAGAAVAVGVLAVGGIYALVGSGDDPLQPADAPSTTTSTGTDAGVTTPTATPTPVTANSTSTDVDGSSTADTTNNTTNDTTTNDTTDDTTDNSTAADPIETVEYVPAGQYAGPMFEERTSAITDPLADGLYYSQEYTSDGITVTFRLIQRIRGQACIDEFGDGADDACASDSGTISDPSTTVTMSADTSDTSIIFFDNATFEAYLVPAEEFIGLAAGRAPSAGAPEGYEWFPWGTYVTVQDGRVVAAHQQFQS